MKVRLPAVPDESGRRWGIGRCECGCVYLYALDDLAVVRGAGDLETEDPEARCENRWCRCHAPRAYAERLSPPRGPAIVRVDDPIEEQVPRGVPDLSRL